MLLKASLLLILAIALSACNLPFSGTDATQTSILPTPSNTAETVPATDAPTEAVATDPPATADPGDGAHLEAIVIVSPGLFSVVRSPVTVSGQSRPTFEQHLVVAVYDEAGEVLALQPTIIASEAGTAGPYTIDLSFSVASEQPGRISVYETSARDGGIIHLTSVEVTLSPSSSSIGPNEISLESIAIEFPPPNVELGSGSIEVTGFSDYYFESNLGLMLCGQGGSGGPHDLCGTDDNILVSTFAMIDAPDMGLPGPFAGELTFSVSEPTPARIVVYATSPRDGGLLHVSSIPVLLVP
ncbi:MAG: Gmad2 immunoglobulin-like domain-containing protein [Anaerolineales bacterium]